MLSFTHISLVAGTVLLGLSLHEPVLICDTWALTIKEGNNHQPQHNYITIPQCCSKRIHETNIKNHHQVYHH
uniref:Secreted protein n=1 Tax=Arundo donax TaxID=35708 RepID=A0A0A9GR25_ARUDO